MLCLFPTRVICTSVLDLTAPKSWQPAGAQRCTAAVSPHCFVQHVPAWERLMHRWHVADADAVRAGSGSGRSLTQPAQLCKQMQRIKLCASAPLSWLSQHLPPVKKAQIRRRVWMMHPTYQRYRSTMCRDAVHAAAAKHHTHAGTVSRSKCMLAAAGVC